MSYFYKEITNVSKAKEGGVAERGERKEGEGERAEGNEGGGKKKKKKDKKKKNEPSFAGDREVKGVGRE